MPDESEQSITTTYQCYLTLKSEYFVLDVGGLALTHLMCFFNQGKMSPFFIISRHALSQLANHYGKAGGALIQDNNTPWAFRATVMLRAFQQHCTVLRKPNWVVEHGGGGGGKRVRK